MKRLTKKSKSMSSFFAGIGGFDLGFEAAGFKTVLQCEINGFCNDVLELRWPKVKRLEDINLVEPSDIPESNIWCGGFPCQDVSVARGSKGREGLAGKNSGLFYPFLDLIKAKLPDVLLLENVVGLLSSHNGEDFRVILEELNALGYSVAWRVMNSRYYGAPQSRPRVFICASLSNPEIPLMTLYENKSGQWPKNAREGFLSGDECQFSGAKVPKVAYCLAATSGRHTGTDWSRTYISYDDAVRRMTPTECEGLQGFPTGWTDIARSRGSNHDSFETQRYHALGNSVAVPVISWIAKRLKKAMVQETRLINGFPIDLALAAYPDFNSAKYRQLSISEIKGDALSKIKWSSGGYARKGQSIDISVPAAPSKIIESPLIKVVEKTKPADHYYLSSNAAEGILRRVKSQNRTLFGPMSNALEVMVKAQNTP